jgi:hypothetical protein
VKLKFKTNAELAELTGRNDINIVSLAPFTRSLALSASISKTEVQFVTLICSPIGFL